MNEAQAQAFHDTISKLKPKGRKGLGSHAANFSNNTDAIDNGLPKNGLYANFVREMGDDFEYNEYGDGRTIKRNFDDCGDNLLVGDEIYGGKKKEKKLSKEERKAAKKAAKMEAKRQIKLEEKRRLKREAKAKVKVLEEERKDVEKMCRSSKNEEEENNKKKKKRKRDEESNESGFSTETVSKNIVLNEDYSKSKKSNHTVLVDASETKELKGISKKKKKEKKEKKERKKKSSKSE
uniref:Uncharacterized protein n=1 Tax=Leptocylindrus danicus TaxID=163516 RepID=A0A7S2KF97_9STRA|mmetsp:Transcript_22227/g.33370  ORF Transcript_22227/g.33370 Transcript_22227/m.33370 type:complete len:236 (+) Transcript_22227:118-825(+)